MLPNFGPLLGQPAFEQARGIVMELRTCTAEQAFALMIEIARSTRRTPEDLVAALRAPSSRVELLHLFEFDAN